MAGVEGLRQLYSYVFLWGQLEGWAQPGLSPSSCCLRASPRGLSSRVVRLLTGQPRASTLRDRNQKLSVFQCHRYCHRVTSTTWDWSEWSQSPPRFKRWREKGREKTLPLNERNVKDLWSSLTCYKIQLKCWKCPNVSDTFLSIKSDSPQRN